ncbi:MULTISPECIES: 2-succinyl-5-enolpyruvyl-6-hydroxy-3-cyclohexene-1-carboxylic-acid synthase [unclassified Prochlorococcus]|uniref:2-succinyl-5-enolpyruvyl-6-hydroxy-3- cyclohexene-1-carboxylic-acid synthase n=1 Tax=Prochlorococcus sp. MIT 0602 TaxID=1499499 RepID=UPI000690C61A|nr:MULTISPECIES: 2-succinyl-5-enolpyruvyl-6-hydroxy-3-cyclohexene-1-carboxylic-acid synthase [unclassified Prochlorococcus]
MKLLRALYNKGLLDVVLCPGSRSAPLALALGGMAEDLQFNLYTAIDERSAAFMALGISTATGKATAVITTSGTAVSNLLPAAVEADKSCVPLIFITADRPERLKNCGANQSVNQEQFLTSVCRSVIKAPSKGIHTLTNRSLISLVNNVWNEAHAFPGPVHLNLPIEEPLHPSTTEQKKAWLGWELDSFDNDNKPDLIHNPLERTSEPFQDLDPLLFGIILVGPWRGKPENIGAFRNSVKVFQALTGWPIFADPLSGLMKDQPGLIHYWELLIATNNINSDQDLQILRLGPLTASRNLEGFIKSLSNKNHILITEGEKRPLDPLHMAKQYSLGFDSWLKVFISKHVNLQNHSSIKNLELLNSLMAKNNQIHSYLDKKLSSNGIINEPKIAHNISNILPAKMPIMLSASSPIRDFFTFSGSSSFARRCFSYRGTSGIDGNISMAIGLSLAIGPLVLICGDLSFFHDSNAFLLKQPRDHPLIIFLIDNKGGGIFNQLNLDKPTKGNVDKLFIMPQSVQLSSLAKAYSIPYKHLLSFEDFSLTFDWCMKHRGPVLIHIATDSRADNLLRKNITKELNKLII